MNETTTHAFGEQVWLGRTPESDRFWAIPTEADAQQWAADDPRRFVIGPVPIPADLQERSAKWSTPVAEWAE